MTYPYADLREYLQFLDERGLLVRVDRPIDKDTELVPLVRLQFRGLAEEDRKAFLFTDVRGAGGDRREGAVAIGTFASSRAVYAAAVGVELSEVGAAWERAFSTPIEPRRVELAPCQEVVLTTDEELNERGGVDRFPHPISTPGFDNAPYLTSPYWVTRDPESGEYNVGTYRGMIKGPRQVGLQMDTPSQHIAIHLRKARELGVSLEVAIVIGAVPAVGLASVQKLPYGMSEYTVAGGLMQRPLDVVSARTVDIDVPATAELIIEGRIDPTQVAPEGPFGEASGYMGPRTWSPTLEVSAITHRREPIVQAFISEFPPSESTLMRKLGFENVYRRFLRSSCNIDSVRDVNFFEMASCNMMFVIRMANPGPGQAWQALNAAASYEPSMGKIIVAVDDDIRFEDPEQLIWALSFRTQPHRDVKVIGDRLPRLDPSMPLPPGEPPVASASAMLIDATRSHPYPPISLPTRERMEHARALWAQLGLPALELREPWHGYELGGWGDENRHEAGLATQGRYLETGSALEAQRRTQHEARVASDTRDETRPIDREGADLMSRYGSDVIVDGLKRLGMPFISLNPGASYRGLHDSLVHHGEPEKILTLSENVAVALAHGYAKTTGEPMAAALHNVVGLQNASMAIFNAWIDQAPMVLLGGSGPADHAQRRPWIDWIHTAKPQGAIIRDVVKWDDEPRSVAGIPASMARAHAIAMTAPQGPTYLAFDSLLQEEPVPTDLDLSLEPLKIGRLTTPPAELEQMATALLAADAPVIIADMAGRSRAAFDALQRLAESLCAPVIDLQGRHNFPTTHWADGSLDRARFLRRADVVLAVDVRDLRFATSVSDMAAHGFDPLISARTQVLSMGLNDLLHSGMFDREPVMGRTVNALADSAVALPALADLVEASAGNRDERRRVLSEEVQQLKAEAERANVAQAGRMNETTLAAAVWEAVRHEPWLLANGGLRGSTRRTWQFEEFGCYLGGSGGEGLGYGLGASIGAALAHRGNDRLVVDMQTDGDFLYSASALWTAAQQQLPLLTVVVNNRTYGRDRTHQGVVAAARGRALDDAVIGTGIDIEDPAVDFGMMAEAQGVESFGRVTESHELAPTLKRAVEAVRQDARPALVEVVIDRRD